MQPPPIHDMNALPFISIHEALASIHDAERHQFIVDDELALP